MTRTLRALYCTDTYPPQVNGVSVVTALSVEGLRRRGWEVTVISPRYPDGLADVFKGAEHGGASREDAVIASVPMPGYPDIRLAAPRRKTVRQVMDRVRPDIVHSATEFMIGWMGQREALKRGIVSVSSYHTDFSRYTEAYGVPSLRGMVQRYLARFHRRSARVFTPGSVAVAELEALGVHRAALWGRGVDLTLFDPAHRDCSTITIPGVTDETVVFLHVGRLAAEKGVERILESFRLARGLLPANVSTHLIIAGDGPARPTLRAMASPDVTFLGNLDRRTVLPTLYASADAFLFASHTETLGLVILEAMASGLPVIAAPAGGVADHLRDDENGLAYPPGDVAAMAEAIVRVATTPELARRLGAGGRQTAERLSWAEELDRLDQHYRELLPANLGA
ncbi:MAG: glycosyltransferase family 1 protein [Gemmatimonadales bacterium]|nr:glycosyltransferase family 1 protein [Gemmatimonadales bacterium]